MTALASPHAGPSRGSDTWRPERYLEPNLPDNEEVFEQAAYQAAVTRLGGDNRQGPRKYKPRKTVDFMGPVLKWRQMNKLRGVGYMPPIHPSPSDLIALLPPDAHRNNPSTSICDQFIHTSINKERSPTRIVKWTPDARRLLTGNDKGQFTLWNGSSFNYESITQVHDDSIRSMAYSHNGQSLVSSDKTGMIKYFTPHLTNIHGFQGHREACSGVAWSPNDEWFVTGGDDGLVKVWNYREGREERVLSGHGWDVRCVDWHPTKGLVVSGSKDMLVKFWDPRSDRCLSTLHSHKSTINACKWSPSGHIIATAGGDGSIKMFDIRTFKELDSLKGHTKEVNCLEWHPTHHNILASGDAAGAIIYWSLLSQTPSLPVTVLSAAHDDAINSLSFHPLGHILCSGSKDFTARFWCRARPAGGQEIDRWHLGEEGAMNARQEEVERRAEREREMEREVRGGEEVVGGLPGLPGLGEQRYGGNTGFGNGNGNGSGNGSGTFMGLPGLGGSGGSGLPGFGGGPTPTMNPTQNAPPQKRWGGMGEVAGGGVGMRSAAPLLSQAEMLKQTGAPPGRGGGNSYGGGGSNGYGGNSGYSGGQGGYGRR